MTSALCFDVTTVDTTVLPGGFVDPVPSFTLPVSLLLVDLCSTKGFFKRESSMDNFRECADCIRQQYISGG